MKTTHCISYRAHGEPYRWWVHDRREAELLASTMKARWLSEVKVVAVKYKELP